jgi:hypothetical protein
VTGVRRPPAATANAKASAAAASARVPVWPPRIDSYRAERTRSLPSRHPRLAAPAEGGQQWLVRHRGERDLDGQAVAAPGAHGDRGIVGGGDGADDGQA